MATFVLSFWNEFIQPKKESENNLYKFSDMIPFGNTLLFIFLSRSTYHFNNGLLIYRSIQIIQSECLHWKCVHLDFSWFLHSLYAECLFWDGFLARPYILTVVNGLNCRLLWGVSYYLFYFYFLWVIVNYLITFGPSE